MASLKRTCEDSGNAPSSPKRLRPLKRVVSREDGRPRMLEERLVATEELLTEDLPELLNLFADRTLVWSDASRRLRSAALLLTYMARASPACSADFQLLGGLTLLGEVLHEAVASLQSGAMGSAREDADMRALACLRCLHSLPMEQAPAVEEITSSLTKLQALSAHSGLSKGAAELCQRWQLKPKQTSLAEDGPSPSPRGRSLVARISGTSPGTSPASVTKSKGPLSAALHEAAKATATYRSKATELIAQGFLGTAQGIALAEKVEVALFCLHGGATPKYRQQARMLKSNLALPGNADLRFRLLTGELIVEHLVSMDSTALAPEAIQEERRDQQQKAKRLAIIPGLVLGKDSSESVEEDQEDAPALVGSPIPTSLTPSARSRSGGA